MENPKVSIIILNWNGWKDIIECLESLYQITYPNYDVIVVDNGSEDDSIEKIKEYCEGKIKVKSKFFEYFSENKPIKIIEYTRKEAGVGGSKEYELIINLPSNRKLTIIKNEKNYGFAEGNNIGARYALENLNPDYFLLLNNDTVVEPRFLTELVKVAQSDTEIGIVGGKIYLYGTNNFDSAGSLFTNIGSGRSRGHLEEDKGQYDSQEEVPMITACCLLARTEIFKSTYLFDPSFFLYLEELDFTIRVRRLGYKVVYVPRAIIYHKFSQSVRRAHSQTVLFKQFHGHVNRGRILARYYPFKILLRNCHLILLSYLYDEYYFLRWGGISWFFKLNYHLLRSLLLAVRERLHYWDRGESDWTKWITYYSLKEYMHLRQQMEQRYHHK